MLRLPVVGAGVTGPIHRSFAIAGAASRPAASRAPTLRSGGRGAGANLLDFVLLAVGHHIAGAAIRLADPRRFEGLHEFAHRRLLPSGRHRDSYRRLSLRQALLAARRTGEYLEDVIAERRLHRAAEYVQLGGEHRLVERSN